MTIIQHVVWTKYDHALWARVVAHDFEPAGDYLTFTGRLARDHGWSLATAQRAVEEYRRFCFLALRGEGAVTPSEEVDEVWHQHLTFSRDYWQIWCADVLRADLHHQPTRGGPAEGRRFAEQYARTLALYEAWFEPPPADLWPGIAARFGPQPRYRLVDTRRALIVPLPWRPGAAWIRSLAATALIVTLTTCMTADPARAQALDVLDWTAGPFLTFYVVAAVLSLAAARYVPLLLASQPPGVLRRSRLEPVELAMLASGRERAADVLILDAIAAGDASVSGRVILLDGRSTDRATLARDLSGTLDGVQSRLADQGLVLRARRRLLFRWAGVATMMPVVALGLAKVAVGLERDKPVGILVFLLAATCLGTIAGSMKRRPASLAGRRAVGAYRDENDRAIRAPTPNEVIAAFACIGVAALVCSDLSAYGELLKASGDAGGGGGCGGGGGGCGGCGG